MKTDSILDKICALKSEELECEKRTIGFGELYSMAMDSPARAPFAAALKRGADGTPAVIAELKKASPSAGLIRADFRPGELAKSLAGAGAAALSVLTEKNFFMGSAENLKIAADSVSIPILRKDFIFDKYQICQAKVWGASAVLLIAAMLSRAEFEELFGLSGRQVPFPQKPYELSDLPVVDVEEAEQRTPLGQIPAVVVYQGVYSLYDVVLHQRGASEECENQQTGVFEHGF